MHEDEDRRSNNRPTAAFAVD